jgi:hypothetical protein
VSPEDALLNEHQRRHIETTLQLLGESLRELAALPAPRGREAMWRRIAGDIAMAEAAVVRIADGFGLETVRSADPLQRVGSIAAAWSADLADLSAARLRRYGHVHPELAAVLDPAVVDLRQRLLAIAKAVRGEGDTC